MKIYVPNRWMMLSRACCSIFLIHIITMTFLVAKPMDHPYKLVLHAIKDSKLTIAPDPVTVIGIVTDGETKEPLPGASVIVSGATIGTVTDIEGRFKLSVPEEYSKISVSYTGYVTQELSLDGQTDFTVVLQPDVSQLQELVVMGYDTQRKKDITGAVSTVDPEEIKTLPTASVEKMLDGRMPGVQVLSDNGPGGNVTVRVRGYSTINNNDPLYVIDGIPVTNGLNSINPADVASIQVLKDAAASSIYGSRAANGVVVITTRQGNSEESVIELNGYAGVQQAFNLPRMLNAQQYGDVLWQSTKNDGGVPASDIYGNDPNQPAISAFLNDEQTIPSADVDWVQEIFHPAAVQNYNLSVSKGNEDGRHALSLGYFNQEGIIKYTGFDRFSVRFNSSYTIKDILTVGENFTTSYTRTREVGTNSALGSIVYDAFQFPSIVPVYDDEGNFGGNPINDLGNPLGNLYRSKDNVRKRIKALGNVYASVDLEHFSFKTNIGLDFENFNYRGFSPTYDEILSQQAINSLATSSNFNYQLTWSNTVNYNQTFGPHHVEALLGQEAIKYYYEGFSASRQNFLYEDPNFRFLSYGVENQLNGGDATQWSLLSYFGKVNYSYQDKYLFTATLRRDGTSRLSQNQWGTFPAFSAGWRISEEPFFDFGSGFSSLKLRASWGQTGNQQVPAYSTVNSYSNNTANSDYAIDGAQETINKGLVQTRIANANLAWEVTNQASVGLDFGFLRDKLTVSADYYNKVTNDILVYAPVPLTYGGSNDGQWINGGQMKNKGLELAAKYNNTSGELSYNLGLNLTAYTNRLTRLDSVAYLGLPGSALHSVNFDQEISRSTVDQPIGAFYGYVAYGLFENQEQIDAYGLQPNAQPGDIRFADVNGDDELNGDDRTYIGSPHPNVIIGFNVNMYYKGFDLNLFFNGSLGGDIYNLTKYKTQFFNQAAYNKSVAILDAWSPTNTDTNIPRLSLDDPNNNIRPSSYYLESGSYIKLNNMQLGYNFPQDKVGGLNLRVYAQASNLFTITGYSGMTPEIGLQNYSSSNRNLDIGVDRGIYPPSRNFVLGINLKL